MIAQVIVDVAARQTDRVFEYHIPSDIEKEIQVGSRVVVPFGPRKVQGFVVGLSETSNFKGKMKDLLVVVDEMPPLTPELVKLSADLAQNIYSYRIKILQAMLPWVMRAGYRKLLLPTSSEAKKMPFFQGDPIDLNKITDSMQIKKIRTLLKNNDAKIEYIVDNKAKKKKENQYSLALAPEEYTKIYNTLRQNAVKQKQLLMDIVEHTDDYPKTQKDLETELDLTAAVLNSAVKKGWLKKKAVEVYRDPLAGFKDDEKPAPIKLNDEQQHALDEIAKAIDEKKAETFLLEGITGSGKTEVYLHAISKALAQGRTALMLVPEISLTPQMVRQVKARFGQEVAVLHSALSEGEKYDEWRRIRRGETKVVVGARSAVFAPLKNIGLIVIDEEHESSYKQESDPRYNARDVAIWRSKYHHCPLVLGSATPSLGSRARAQKNVYHLLRLTKRANNKKLPKVRLIDLKHVQFAGGQFDLSLELVDAIKK